jgi:hypothetical protein
VAVEDDGTSIEKAAGADSSDLHPNWLPTVDTLGDLFLQDNGRNAGGFS